MHLAQINVGRLLHPLDDPRMADFVDNLDKINALAEASEGFVWRLKDETGNATSIAAYDDPAIIVNMSVWTSPEALYAFAYQTAHRRFVQRRKEWFQLFDGPYLALWWVGEGAIPDGGGRAAAARPSRPRRADGLCLHLPEGLPAGGGGAGRRPPTIRSPVGTEAYRSCG